MTRDPWHYEGGLRTAPKIQKQTHTGSIYNRKVLFVCVSRKMITLPTSLKSSSLAVFMVIHGSRLVFHGSRSVFMVFQSFRLVFHGSRSVFIFSMFLGWFFMVPGRFLWFFMVPG